MVCFMELYRDNKYMYIELQVGSNEKYYTQTKDR